MKNGELGFYIRSGKLHEYSVANDIFKGNAFDGKTGEKTLAQSWLDGYEMDDHSEMLEDSVKYDEAIASIIFVEDDIGMPSRFR